MDTATRELLKRAEAYGRRNKLLLTTVSRMIMGNTYRLTDIKAGKETYLRPPTIKRALKNLAELEAGEDKGRVSKKNSAALVA